MAERELEEDMSLEDRGIGHLFQGESPDVVWDTWELIEEWACEECAEQCLEALGNSIWTKIIRWGMGVGDM